MIGRSIKTVQGRARSRGLFFILLAVPARGLDDHEAASRGIAVLDQPNSSYRTAEPLCHGGFLAQSDGTRGGL